MSNWTDEKVEFLKKNWGSCTARELAEKMGAGFTRNSIIGKASRLGLSAKIKTRTATSNQNFDNSIENKNVTSKRGRRNKFKSFTLQKDILINKNVIQTLILFFIDIVSPFNNFNFYFCRSFLNKIQL